MTRSVEASRDTIETKVPARLDRLPWSRFHWLVVIGLGARYRGPGHFASALREAVAEGRARRLPRGQLGPAHGGRDGAAPGARV